MRWITAAIVAYALFIDYLVYGLILPLTPLSPAGITADEQLSMLAGTYGLGVLTATPFFGYFGDRIGFKLPMIGGAVLLACATALFAFAPNMELMVAGRLLQGFAAAASWTSGLALIGSSYTGDVRVKMMGYALMGSTGGSVLGPVLGGWLVHVGGYRLPFLAVLGLIAIGIVALWVALPRDVLVKSAKAPNFLVILRDRSVFIPALAVVLAASAWSVLEPIVPNHMRRAGIDDTALVGAVFTISTLVYGFSAPLVSWLVPRIGTTKTLVIGAVIMAASLPLVAAVGSFGLIVLVISIANIGYALLLNPTSAALGEAVEARGEGGYSMVYAIYNIAYSIGTIGVSALATMVLPVTNVLVVLLIVAGLLVVSVPFLLRSGLEEAKT